MDTRGGVYNDPNIGQIYADFKRVGYTHIEHAMAMLRESSKPSGAPTVRWWRTEHEKKEYDGFVNGGFLEWRQFLDRTFLMETEEGRAFEIGWPDRDGDGDYDLSPTFMFVMEVESDGRVRYVDPLSLLRAGNLVKKNSDTPPEYQWVDKGGAFRPFPAVEHILTFHTSAGTPK